VAKKLAAGILLCGHRQKIFREVGARAKEEQRRRTIKPL
jgi:hypothetical protein